MPPMWPQRGYCMRVARCDSLRAFVMLQGACGERSRWEDSPRMGFGCASQDHPPILGRPPPRLETQPRAFLRLSVGDFWMLFEWFSSSGRTRAIPEMPLFEKRQPLKQRLGSRTGRQGALAVTTAWVNPEQRYHVYWCNSLIVATGLGFMSGDY